MQCVIWHSCQAMFCWGSLVNESASVDRWLGWSAVGPKVVGSIPTADVAFRRRRNGRAPCTVWYQCTLNTRWSEFPEPFTTASIIIISGFRDVKPVDETKTKSGALSSVRHRLGDVTNTKWSEGCFNGGNNCDASYMHTCVGKQLKLLATET